MTGAKDKGASPYGCYALGVLTLVYMLNFIDRQILSILANDIKQDLQIGDAQLGFLYGTAFAIFYALFGIPLGMLADRWSRVRLLAFGLTLWSLMTAASGFARSLASLSLARIGVGIGEATASPCAYSLISDWFPQRLRGTAIAVYSSGLFLGSGVSLVIGGAIVEFWDATFPDTQPLGLAGWQAAFLAVGLPGLLLAIWVLTLREPERTEVTPPTHARWAAQQMMDIVPPLTIIGAFRRGPRVLTANIVSAILIGAISWLLAGLTGSSEQFLLLGTGYYCVASWALALKHDDGDAFRQTFASLPFIAIVLAYGAICFVGYSVTYWAAPYAERTFAISKAELGWLIGAPAALGGFLGVLMGGSLADWLQSRFGNGRVLVLAIGLLGPVPLIAIGYSTNSVTVFVICNLLMQLATSTALSSAAAASQALVQPALKGVATAIFFLGTTLIGLGLGPYCVGLISETSGSLAMGMFASLAIVPFGLAAMGVALWSYVGRLPESPIASAGA